MVDPNRESFPRQLTRLELAAKFGIRKHPVHDWDMIEIASDSPLVDNLLWPLSAAPSTRRGPNEREVYQFSIAGRGKTYQYSIAVDSTVRFRIFP
jgi:hypothetical protein